MKKLNLFILFICTMAAVSCGSDDDGTEVSGTGLIGTWQWVSASENGVAETLDECDLQDTIEFRTDGTVINRFFTSISTNNQITCDGPDTDEFGWSLSGDQLTLSATAGGVTESETATVTTLNETTLTIEYRDEDNGEVLVYIETYRRI